MDNIIAVIFTCLLLVLISLLLQLSYNSLYFYPPKPYQPIFLQTKFFKVVFTYLHSKTSNRLCIAGKSLVVIISFFYFTFIYLLTNISN